MTHPVDRQPSPDPPLPVPDLERFRALLARRAKRAIGRALRHKIDLSGVVQQTMLEAVLEGRGSDPPARRSEGETLSWLRAILNHNLADAIRRLKTRRRDVRRERSLEDRGQVGAESRDDRLTAQQSSPSHGAARNEEIERLMAALPRLPENQRRAIELHHLEGRPLAQIAIELGVTKSAVAGLLHRGLKSLRNQLESRNDPMRESESDHGPRRP